jgi:hypothetical protein
MIAVPVVPSITDSEECNKKKDRRRAFAFSPMNFTWTYHGSRITDIALSVPRNDCGRGWLFNGATEDRGGLSEAIAKIQSKTESLQLDGCHNFVAFTNGKNLSTCPSDSSGG